MSAQFAQIETSFFVAICIKYCMYVEKSYEINPKLETNDIINLK